MPGSKEGFLEIFFFLTFFPAVVAAGRSPQPRCEIAAAFCRRRLLVLNKHHRFLWCFRVAPGALPSYRLRLLLSLPHPWQTEHSSPVQNPVGVTLGLGMSEPPVAISVSSASELRSDAQPVSTAQSSFPGLPPE